MKNLKIKIASGVLVFMICLLPAPGISQGVIPRQNKVLSRQWVSNGMEHFNKGDLKKSTECLEKAMMYDPDNQEAQALMYEVMNLALNQVRQKDSQEPEFSDLSDEKTAIPLKESTSNIPVDKLSNIAPSMDETEYFSGQSLEFKNQLSSGADSKNNQTAGTHINQNEPGPDNSNHADYPDPAVNNKKTRKKGFFSSLFSGRLFSKTESSSDKVQQKSAVPESLVDSRAYAENETGLSKKYDPASNPASNTAKERQQKNNLMSLFASGDLVKSRRSPMVSGMMSRAVEYKPQYRIVSSYLKTSPALLNESLAAKSGYEDNYAAAQGPASVKKSSNNPDHELERVRVNELNEMGLEYANKNDFKKAIPLFEKVLKIEPGNLVALNNLALAYAYNDDLYSAIKTYRKIMTLTSPGSEYNRLARSMIKKLKQII
jgi:Tfp pilus assembly protein PilF